MSQYFAIQINRLLLPMLSYISHISVFRPWSSIICVRESTRLWSDWYAADRLDLVLLCNILHTQTLSREGEILLPFLCFLYFMVSYDLSRIMRKPAFCICENKDADQLHDIMTAKLISAFVFATHIVQSLYFRNSKF